MPAVDIRKAERLAQLETAGAGGHIGALLDAFLRPLLEQRNSEGERAYARFISALLRSAEGERYCARLFHLTPTTGRILTALHMALPDVPPGILMERLRLLSGMICTSVFNRVAAVSETETDAGLIDDELDMAAAGLVASVAGLAESARLAAWPVDDR
jgi:hypothetical protein